MSFYDSADAVYGVGRYGSARYGVVSPDVSVLGVSATISVREPHLDVFEVDITEKIYGSASAVTAVGIPTLNLSEKLEAVSANTSVGIVVPQVQVNVGSVETFAEASSVQVNVSEKLESVSASFTINAEGLDIRSINRVPVLGPDVVGLVGTPYVLIKEYVSGTSAAVVVGQTKQNLKVFPAAVSANSSAGILTHSNLTRITSVTLNAVAGVTRENIVDNIVGQGVFSSIGVLTHSNTKRLDTPNLELTLGDLTKTAENFDFYAVRNLYSSQRTVLIPRAA